MKIGKGYHTLFSDIHKIYPFTFHIYCPILFKFCKRSLHIKLFDICEFQENRLREGRTFLTGVSEITATRVP
jgi:hypothetical protein